MLIHVQKTETMALLNWMPSDVHIYLLHTKIGLAIEYLAHQKGYHASTVMRQIRRPEHLRDDPLLEVALRKLGKRYFCRSAISFNNEPKTMTIPPVRPPGTQDDRTLNAHAVRVLHRFVRPVRSWLVANRMEKAIFGRDMPDGSSARIAVLGTIPGQAFALGSGVTYSEKGSISRYRIICVGWGALQGLLAQQDTPQPLQRLCRGASAFYRLLNGGCRGIEDAAR